MEPKHISPGPSVPTVIAEHHNQIDAIQPASVNQFIANVSYLISLEGGAPWIYREGRMSKYEIKWNAKFNLVSIKLLPDFRGDNSNKIFGVQGGDQITYYTCRREALCGLSAAQTALLKRLFMAVNDNFPAENFAAGHDHIL
jgi:hypothetical protein